MDKFILGLLAIFTVTITQAAVSEVDRALIERGNNLLKNGGFESGKAQWTASGGTFTTTTTAANLGKGGVAGSWDSSSASQTLTSTAVAIPAGLYGRNGVASCIIQGAGATHTLQAYDGTNILASQTINSQSNYTRTSVNFIFPSSGNISLRLVSVASNEPVIYIDDCFLGDADGFNISQVSQAQLVGTWTMSEASSCTFSITQTTYASDYSADSDCATPTVTGQLSNSLGKVLQVSYPNAPAGFIKVSALVKVITAGSVNAQCRIVDDLGNQLAEVGITNAAAPMPLYGAREYTTAGNRVFKLQCKSSSGAIIVDNSVATGVAQFVVEKYPSSSEIAYRADVINWKVDANIYGANPSLGTSAVSSYTGITNSGLTLENNSGSGNLTAQIPCSSTNSPTGTTCSVGDESIGVSFTLPKAGDVLACASFSWTAASSASGVVFTTFQIVETPNNAQTISQEGRSRVQGGQNLNGGSSFAGGFPFRVCGTFTFSSVGQKTLRLMYEQAVAGTVTQSTVAADRSASGGQPDVHWEVYPINQSVPAPVLVGSVTSNSSGMERVERAQVDGGTSVTTSCTSSPCNIRSQSGSWLSSVTRTSTGLYVLNIASGIFSSAPQCNITMTAGTDLSKNNGQAATSTSYDIRTYTSGGVISDSAFIVQCMGPK